MRFLHCEPQFLDLTGNCQKHSSNSTLIPSKIIQCNGRKLDEGGQSNCGARRFHCKCLSSCASVRKAPPIAGHCFEALQVCCCNCCSLLPWRPDDSPGPPADHDDVTGCQLAAGPFDGKETPRPGPGSLGQSDRTARPAAVTRSPLSTGRAGRRSPLSNKTGRAPTWWVPVWTCLGLLSFCP